MLKPTTNIFLSSVTLIKTNFTRTLPNLIRLMMYSKKTLSLNQDNPMELTFFLSIPRTDFSYGEFIHTDTIHAGMAS